MIPEAVQREAADLCRTYNGTVEHLGEYEGQDAYYVKIPEEYVVGFPTVFLLKDGGVLSVGGPAALDIITRFI